MKVSRTRASEKWNLDTKSVLPRRCQEVCEDHSFLTQACLFIFHASLLKVEYITDLGTSLWKRIWLIMIILDEFTMSIISMHNMV